MDQSLNALLFYRLLIQKTDDFKEGHWNGQFLGHFWLPGKHRKVITFFFGQLSLVLGGKVDGNQLQLPFQVEGFLKL